MKLLFRYLIILSISSTPLLAQVSMGTTVINESTVLKLGHGTDNKALVVPIVTDLATFGADTANNKQGMIFFDNNVSEKCLKFLRADKSISPCILTEDEVSTPSAQEQTLASFNVTSTSYTNILSSITIGQDNFLDRTTLISFTTRRDISHASSVCAKIEVQLLREDLNDSGRNKVLREYTLDNAVTLSNELLQHPLSFTYYDETPRGSNQRYSVQVKKDASCSPSTNQLKNNSFKAIAY